MLFVKQNLHIRECDHITQVGVEPVPIPLTAFPVHGV